MKHRLTVAVAMLALAAGGCMESDEPVFRFDRSAPAAVETRTIDSSHGGRVTLVRAAIDGRDAGWFLLESALSRIAVDTSLAAEFDLAESGRGRLPRPCRTPVAFHLVDAFSVGPLTIRNSVLASVDLSALRRAHGEDIVGVVGFPIFQKAVVRIEYAGPEGNDQVSIYDPARFDPPAAVWKPMIMDGFEMLVPCRVGPAVEGNFVLDTGYPGTAAVFSVFAVNNRLLEGRRTTERPGVTLCGDVVDLEAQIREFTLAGRRFESPRIAFMQPGSAADAYAGQLGGIVGRGFLEDFTLVVSVPSQQIAFIDRSAD